VNLKENERTKGGSSDLFISNLKVREKERKTL